MYNPKPQFKILRHLRWMQEQPSLHSQRGLGHACRAKSCSSAGTRVQLPRAAVTRTRTWPPPEHVARGGGRGSARALCSSRDVGAARAGTGLLGLGAAKLGAHVCITDRAELMYLIQENVRRVLTPVRLTRQYKRVLGTRVYTCRTLAGARPDFGTLGVLIHEEQRRCAAHDPRAAHHSAHAGP